MFRSMLVSLGMLGIFVSVSFSNVEQTATKETDKKAKEATIVKIDGKKNTVQVSMKVDGKDVEKTFKLADNIEYADSTGKVAVIDIFTSGDMVLFVEEDGTVSKLKKCEKPAKPNN